MPRAIVVPRVKVPYGVDVTLTHRVITADGTPIQQSDISGNITVTVHDKALAGAGRDPGTAIWTKTDVSPTTGGPGGGAVISNSYETTYWDGKDSTGYNAAYILQFDTASSDGPYTRAGHTYVVNFSCESTAFGTIRWSTIIDVASSGV